MLMSGSEEDPYSQIFSSLKHPTRRLLLRSLKERPSKRFSKLQSELVIDSPTLSYHLDALRGLVEKNGEGYSLTELGAAAYNLMGRVEETKKRRTPTLSHRVRSGIGLVMVIVLLSWGVFALTWTIPNDRVTILDSVLHGQPWTYGHSISVPPGTNGTFVLGMFHQSPSPGLTGGGLLNGFMIYDVPMTSSNPWEVKLEYAVFSFLIAFNGSSNATFWMTDPQGSLAPLSCGLSCSVAITPRIVPWLSGGSVRGSWFTEMMGEGNYTFWIQNTGPGVAYGNVTAGASTVTYSRPYFLAGLLTIVPAAGYLGLAAYSIGGSVQRSMNQNDLEVRKPTGGEAKTMGASTPASFLKKCKWCGYDLPIAAESCYKCGELLT